IPVQIGTDTDWAYVKAGGHHAIGLKQDGTLWGWGNNTYGQLGADVPLDNPEPVQLSSETFSQAGCGFYHTAAIRTDGTLWVTGQNGSGQLGLGDFSTRYAFTQAGTDATWVTLSVGAFSTMMIKASGAMFSCGLNTYGG